MKEENWSIRKMRATRNTSTLKNTYRESKPMITEDKTESKFNGNQTMLSLFLNRVRILLEEE